MRSGGYARGGEDPAAMMTGTLGGARGAHVAGLPPPSSTSSARDSATRTKRWSSAPSSCCATSDDASRICGRSGAPGLDARRVASGRRGRAYSSSGARVRRHQHWRRRRQGCRGRRATGGGGRRAGVRAKERRATRIAPSAPAGFHADDERGPDPRWREASATAAATAELVERFCRGSPKHLKAFLLEDLRVAADVLQDQPKSRTLTPLNVLMPALLARGPSPRHALAAEETSRREGLLEAFDARKAPRTFEDETRSRPGHSALDAFPDEIEVKGEECRQAVSVLKRGARDPNPASQIHALACLFQLLHAFINAANAFSPVVYKTIVFMLIERHAHPLRARLHLRRTQGGTRHAPQHPRGYPRGPHREAGEPRRSTPACDASTSRSSRPCPNTPDSRRDRARQTPRVGLRTALDHAAGDNPADDRAVALRATRLAARLKGEEAAEAPARERDAPGGALARIAAEMDEPSDPFFGETQRWVVRCCTATAHSMVAVKGDPVVGRDRAIVATPPLTILREQRCRAP